MKAPDEEHGVSTFSLDVYFAQGKTGNPTLARHLETCERCKEYLSELETMATTAPAPSMLASRASSAPAKRPLLRWAGAATIGSVALAAGFAWFAVSGEREGEPGSYVASKGEPGAQAIVRSEGRSQIWDGKRPLRPGDAIALRVSCEGFAHVAVVTPSPSGGGWSRLFDGACPRGNEPLPFTLVADDKPGDERLALVFSTASVEDGALRSAATRGDRTPEIWVVRFSFRKVVTGP